MPHVGDPADRHTSSRGPGPSKGQIRYWNARGELHRGDGPASVAWSIYGSYLCWSINGTYESTHGPRSVEGNGAIQWATNNRAVAFLSGHHPAM